VSVQIRDFVIAKLESATAFLVTKVPVVPELLALRIAMEMESVAPLKKVVWIILWITLLGMVR